MIVFFVDVRLCILIFFNIENRSSNNNNQGKIGNSDSNQSQTHYSPHTSSSDTSHIWNPLDSLNSSFSSASSRVDYDPISALYGPEVRHDSNLTKTTDDSSMVYTPSHQSIKQEQNNSKKQVPPQLKSTPPYKKPKKDEMSTLPTPPPSTEFSSAAAKMMVNKCYYLLN